MNLGLYDQFENIRNGLSAPWLRWLMWIWVLFLSWIVIGGAIGEVLLWTGFVEGFCDPSGTSDVYEPCTPCRMHASVFGVLETNPCPNLLVQYMLYYGISWPRGIVISLALFVYVLVEILHSISQYLPAIILIPTSLAILLRTLFINFIKRKNVLRGIHRGLLATWLALATLSALSW